MNKETAQAYMEALTRYFTAKFGDAPEFSLHDHKHEELEAGQWSITAEGWSDRDGRNWVSCIPSSDKAPKYLSKLGVNTFSVGVYCTVGIEA